jgi:hypothetical protein
MRLAKRLAIRKASDFLNSRLDVSHHTADDDKRAKERAFLKNPDANASKIPYPIKKALFLRNRFGTITWMPAAPPPYGISQITQL